VAGAKSKERVERVVEGGNKKALSKEGKGDQGNSPGAGETYVKGQVNRQPKAEL